MVLMDKIEFFHLKKLLIGVEKLYKQCICNLNKLYKYKKECVYLVLRRLFESKNYLNAAGSLT